MELECKGEYEHIYNDKKNNKCNEIHFGDLSIISKFDRWGRTTEIMN